MRFSKDALLLYAVTDRGWVGKRTLYEQLEDALKGGVTMVQLREKNLAADALASEALRVKALCHGYHVPLIINDFADTALRCGADGVHVGVEDAPIAEIRKKAGPHFIIGATAKTVEQARAAEKAGADYLGVGAVFPSPTKQHAIRITTQTLREICRSVSIPVVAIGGISLDNVMELSGCGMDGIAVVSALFAADNIMSTAARLKEKAQAVTLKAGLAERRSSG